MRHRSHPTYEGNTTKFWSRSFTFVRKGVWAMNRRISIALAVVVVSFTALATDTASAQGHHSYGMPHTITVRFEPPYVKVGDTVNVITTFVPCVDIESLYVDVWLPPEVRVDSTGGNIRGLRGRVKKDEPMVISGRAVFPKPGLYLLEVGYAHFDPRRRHERRTETRNFRFLIPGGILTPRPKDEVPIWVDRAPEGAEGASRGETASRYRVLPGKGSARDSTVGKCQGGVGGDSTPAELASPSTGGNLEFTGQVAFTTVDEDSNGLAEALAVDAEVRVLEAGKYRISGYLSRQGEFITNGPRRTSPRFSTVFLDVAPGTYAAHLEFSGEAIFSHGRNGPYDVELRAFGLSGLEDTLESSTPSYAYTTFGEVMVTFTSATDSGVDLDDDGKYDVLRTTLHVSVRAPGTFAVDGGLSKDSVSLASSGLAVPLQTGDQTVNLDFPGVKIRKRNLDGPYRVSVSICDTLQVNFSSLKHTTAAYSASDFDVSALTPTGNHDDQGLDLDQDGEYEVLRASFEFYSEVSGPVTIVGALAEQGSQLPREQSAGRLSPPSSNGDSTNHQKESFSSAFLRALSSTLA